MAERTENEKDDVVRHDPVRLWNKRNTKLMAVTLLMPLVMACMDTGFLTYQSIADSVIYRYFLSKDEIGDIGVLLNYPYLIAYLMTPSAVGVYLLDANGLIKTWVMLATLIVVLPLAVAVLVILAAAKKGITIF